ncbi:MAG TPA: PhoD-like phosphatase N-terminal domain-containing protein, partial [Verrucomicrobiaceae bacterium]
MRSKSSLSRRQFIRTSAGAAVAAPLSAALSPTEARQATGVRVGEVTDTTAIVWTRLTKHATRNQSGVVFAAKEKGKAKAKGGKENAEAVPPVHDIEGACPAAAGQVRVRYSLREDLKDAVETRWVEVAEEMDGIHHFALANLKPGSTYYYGSESKGPDGAA